MTIAPDLLPAWLAGRSIARSLPAPVPDHGGWRVDTNSETERCRWVFAAIDDRVRALAASIETPGLFIKACVGDAELAAALPTGWQMHDASWFMTTDGASAAAPLPAGYTIGVTCEQDVTTVTIHAADGTLAASGYAGETPDAFVYDRIVVSPNHQRRGLGGAMMAALAGCRQDRRVTQLLVATHAGRALYERRGWRVIAPYASASRAR